MNCCNFNGCSTDKIKFRNFQFCLTGERRSAGDQMLKSTEITAEIVIFNPSYTGSTDNCYYYADLYCA